MLLMAGNHKRKRKKIVFLDDSITNLGARPGGYITLLSRLLKEVDLEYKYELINAGVDDNTVRDLLERVDKDILSEGADIAVIFIGINDVWLKLNDGGTSEKEFEAAYEAVIKKLEAAAIKIVLCTLPVIGKRIDLNNNQDHKLEKYSCIIRKLATKYELPLADIRQAFLDYNLVFNTKDFEQDILTIDKVYLNNKGNQIAAEEIWKVLQQVSQR